MTQSPSSLPSLMARSYTSRPLVDVANRIGTRTDVAQKKGGTQRTRCISSPSDPSFIPFPTSKEDIDVVLDLPMDSASTARRRDWAQEVAKRQENIKELRRRKATIEHASGLRTRKKAYSISSPSCSPSTTVVKNADTEFLSSLHASIVWRLWHDPSMPSEAFASERLLVTRLHLILMAHGYKDIPVAPVVSASKHHFLKATLAQHMIAHDRPDIQSLPQLVAKSLIRKRNRHRPLRKRTSSEIRAQSKSPLAEAVMDF
ncbi:hypothetical protein SISNIDRAFT_458511, partial [Sistotremastrum niveocremeum HHB9708]